MPEYFFFRKSGNINNFIKYLRSNLSKLILKSDKFRSLFMQEIKIIFRKKEI